MRRLLVLTAIYCANLPGITIAQESTLGRLFYTPAQRAILERQRMHGQPVLSAADNRQTYNGTVRRSDGRNVDWVNGEANWDRQTIAPRIPVGDTLDPTSGEIQSLIGNGQILIKSTKNR